ncbi:MAG: putative toxin-antitoxin system toxin component, PIN family [Bacteroidota bacterium]|nr:putative toxin-antitoxin system toxin component, PIN family [Bacteroidota bacterium]
MLKKQNRVIIDTNLWISFLLTKDLFKLDKMFASHSFTLLFNDTLLNEFLDVAQRPKFKKYFSNELLQELLRQIENHALFITEKSEINVCRDPKDNFLLSLCIDGKATHLITGDKDLLDIKVFGKTKIITITEYLKKFG